MFGLCLSASAGAQSLINAQANEPVVDVWNYANNLAFGYRPQGSLFTGLPDDAGSGADRLAQIVVGFDTAGMGIPTNGDPFDYQVARVTVTARTANDPDTLPLVYDPTYDPYEASLAGGTDPDPGQPIELHGVGFRNGVTASSYQEGANGTPGTPYSGAQGRTAYALGFDEHGVQRDVTNNPSQGFESRPWALGATGEVEPGGVIPQDTILSFDLDLCQPGVRNYIQEGLSQGRLYFSLSSLQPAFFSGGAGGSFALFYMKEDFTHEVFGDSAMTLQVEYVYAPSEPVAAAYRYDASTGKVLVEWEALAGEEFTVWQSRDLLCWELAAEVVAAGGGTLVHEAAVADAEALFFTIRKILP